MVKAAWPAPPSLAYRLLSLVLYPLWILHALRQGLQHQVAKYLWMRLFGTATDATPRVWVHAASVGEVRAVAPLVQALLEQGEKVLFTSFTASGYRAIGQQFSERVKSAVIPFDHQWHCRRFFSRQQIKLGLVMETELWPELLYQASIQPIKLVLINARLSKKSLQTRGMLRGLLTQTLGYFSAILTRNESDYQNLKGFGASVDRISLVGNIKAHRVIESAPPRVIERDYIILASSHADEEHLFLSARPAALANCLLVIAPRHPNRSAAIQTQLTQLGLSYAVRSAEQSITPSTEVYLADTLGELMPLLAHARIVIMGGSFDTTGGHNLMEPASLGCTIITGPCDTNIAADIKLLGNGSGLLQVNDMNECWRVVIELLEDPERALSYGQTARQRLAEQPDIIQLYLNKIAAWL